MLFSVICDALVALFSAFVITYALSLSFYWIFLSCDGEAFSFENAQSRMEEVIGKEKEWLKK